MKRKEKSGHENRLESKRRSLKEAASATGQKSLLTFLKKDSDVSATEKPAQTPQQPSLPEQEGNNKAGNNGNDIPVAGQSLQATSKEIQTSCWYKGKKLDIDWLVLSEECLELTKEIKDNRHRPLIKCLLCSKYEMEVRRFASNARVPLACGVRVDGKDRLCYVVDHLSSPAHNESLRLKQLEESWNNTSDSHPWIKIMKKCQAKTLEFLLRLAVDVYNDCRVETLSARNWPSRSLAFEHSNNLLHVFQNEGWDAEFVPFSHSGSLYHYRDPVTYAEMRDIIGQHEMEKTAQLLKDCLCYSVQIDGSSDRQQVDSKFITARYVPPEEVSVNTLFLGISSSELGGAPGLLDAFVSCLNGIKVETTKLVGVTTDGENANTGKNGSC